jgi:predicted metal-dependent hydrolase
MKNIECMGKTINYELNRRNRKTISIKVDSEGRVLVSAPFFVGDEIIKEIVFKRGEWILKRQEIRKAENENKIIRNGDTISYLGEENTVRLSRSSSKDILVELRDNTFYIHMDTQEHSNNINQIIKEALRGWYINRAKEVFLNRTRYYADKMGLYPEEVRVKGQKTLWGSCSGKNNLNFNYKLLLAPIDVLDYVVVHELAHIRHKNHSKSFWMLVEKHMADYKYKRDWLKVNGHSLERLES